MVSATWRGMSKLSAAGCTISQILATGGSSPRLQRRPPQFSPPACLQTTRRRRACHVREPDAKPMNRRERRHSVRHPADAAALSKPSRIVRRRLDEDDFMTWRPVRRPSRYLPRANEKRLHSALPWRLEKTRIAHHRGNRRPAAQARQRNIPARRRGRTVRLLRCWRSRAQSSRAGLINPRIRGNRRSSAYYRQRVGWADALVLPGRWACQWT
jgi:hypothetical protein